MNTTIHIISYDKQFFENIFQTKTLISMVLERDCSREGMGGGSRWKHVNSQIRHVTPVGMCKWLTKIFAITVKNKQHN